MTFAIKVVPNKRRPHEFYLMRDLTDHVVHVWTRRSEAERILKAMDNDCLELTQDIPKPALDRAVKKKQMNRKDG